MGMHGRGLRGVGRRALATLFLFFCSHQAMAAVWYVNAASTAPTPDGKSWATAFPAIQQAVDVSATGDKVWVARGVYTGTGVNLKAGVTLYGGFTGTETTLNQRDWKTNETIIDGHQARRCVTAADTTSVVDGCTVRNGSAPNDGAVYGGGMYQGTATNCTFTGNVASYGGGMSFGTATNCMFTGNSAKVAGLGGGMYQGTATNCIFTGNTASWRGGGMYSGSATNCTFTGNSANEVGGGMWGGLATNCVICMNTPDDASGSTASFSCLSQYYTGQGNIVGDSLFMRPWMGDFRLRAGSPGIDAGTATGAPATDLLGRARPQGAGVDMGAYEHTAADDAEPVVAPPMFRVNAASMAANPDGLTWETAFATLQDAADRTSYGGEIWVAAGTYTGTGNEVVRLQPGALLLGGFAGGETFREQRNARVNRTVIDGQATRQCVVAPGQTLVDGFVIQNSRFGAGMQWGVATNCTFANNNTGGMRTGTAINCVFTGNRAYQGGGIYHGTATNCIFTNNRAESGGGGVYKGAATNCIFSRNYADWGGGMYESTAMNCTFAGNVGKSQGGSMCLGSATNCILWGDASSDLSDVSVTYSCLTQPQAGEGNIVGEPLFICPWTDDFRLRAGSPGMDVGIATGAPATDLLGRARPQGVGVDMGAYEHIAADDAEPVATPPTLRVNAASTATRPDGLTWETAFPTLQEAADGTGYGGAIWVAAGTYTGTDTVVVRLQLGTTLLGGFAGNETAADQRNAQANRTVIDGQYFHQCVTAGYAVVVDGFILQHGRARLGGGMLRGTARHCTFTGNFVQNVGYDGGYGGGLFRGAALHCAFIGNTANFGGGTAYCTVSNCSYSNNHFRQYGDCYGEECVSFGSGENAYYGTATNCTFDGGSTDGTAIGFTWTTVPEVSGLARTAARDLLTASLLYGGQETEEYSDSVPVDHVLSQNPVAGDRVWQGSEVDLVVSKGPEPVPVPEVVGLARAAARELIAAARLYLGAETEEYSGTVPSDHIIRTQPVAGTVVLSNTAVDLVVSKGPEPVPVPEVVGLTRTAAADALVAAGLVLGHVSGAYSVTVPAGQIVSQAVAPGTPLLPGTAVDVTESLGGIAVPDVTGRPQAAAAASLTGAGLVLGSVTEAYSATVAAGSVVSQQPAAGTAVLPGTVVEVVVSRGAAPLYMPDLAGQSRTQAEAAVAAAGLTLGSVTEAHSATVAAGEVISQSPAAGTEVPPGLAVSFVVSLGPAPVETEGEGEGEPVTADTAKTELAAALEDADGDGDGQLSFTEASAVVPGLTQPVFDAIDSDGDGQLTAAELGVAQDGCRGCAGAAKSRGAAGGDWLAVVMALLGLAAMAGVRKA